MERYEHFPIGIVLLSNVVSLAIYGLGIYIMFQVSWILASLFFLYVLGMEIRLIRYHCVNCYYWGKTCGFGQGRVSAWFFKRGDAAKFCENEMTWKDLLPDLLVSLLPLVTGLVLIIVRFDWMVLFAMILLVVLTTKGNEVVRGSYACRYCKQRDLGCPAESFFKK